MPFRYQGQYEDVETGLYYNRFRYYSPEEGSYISQDPIRLEGQNHNLYGYVSDALIEIDVLGLTCTTALAKDAPIKIPKGATAVIQQKNGYTQVKYTWRSKGFKYEARWHTATPNAPAGSGANWRVTRTKPGSGSTLPQTTQLGLNKNGNKSWISNRKWYDAQNAYSNGTATQAQKDVLAGGHFPSSINSFP